MEPKREDSQSVFNASRYHLRTLADIDRKLRLLEKHIGIGTDPTHFAELSPGTLHEMFTLTQNVLNRIRDRVDNLCRQVLPRPEVNEFVQNVKESMAPPKPPEAIEASIREDVMRYIDAGLERLKEDMKKGPQAQPQAEAKHQHKKHNAQKPPRNGKEKKPDAV